MSFRDTDLAKIHIAKKDLGIDDDTYRLIITTIGGAKSGSAKELTPTGRAKVLQHFVSKGWKPKRATRAGQAPGKRPPRRVVDHEILASLGQVKMIRSIWIQMANAGVVHDRTEQGLRRWIQAASRAHHPQRAGYSAPEFLPEVVAQKITEHLKAWAKRCRVELRD